MHVNVQYVHFFFVFDAEIFLFIYRCGDVI
jgi:hypothetical protein